MKKIMGNRSTILALCTLFVCVKVAYGEINDTKVSAKGATEPDPSSNLCLTPACIHAASMILLSMNSSANPCDDFYEFACGNYANSVSMPDNYITMTPLWKAQEITESRLRRIIEDIDESNAPKHFRLVKTFYKQCINDLSIWKNGTALLNSVMKDIENKNGWPLKELESWNVTKFEYSDTVLSLLEMTARIDKDNNTVRIPNLGEREPPLDRHYLQEGFSNEVVQTYYRYMIDIGVALGFNETVAKLDMNETLSLEIELYQKVFIKYDDHHDLSRRYSKTTVGDLKKKYPILLCLKKFEHVPDLPIQLGFDVETMDRAIKWISEKSKRALANWAAWRTIEKEIPEFGSYFTHRHSTLLRTLEGTEAGNTGSGKCVEKTQKYLGFALFALYQRKHISPSSVDDMILMLGNLKEQFSGLIQKAEWLDFKTRKNALEKVSNMKSSLVTCREAIRDEELEAFYSGGLELSNDSFQKTRRNVNNFFSMKSPSSLVPPSRNVCGISWLATAYTSRYNFIQIAAEQLTGFFHDVDRPKYLNYGVSSGGIGHEMGHSLDVSNINIDKNGIIESWSDLDSKEHYMNRTRCFIEQYDNYTIDDSKTHLNGYLTLGENIADYTGAKIAYQAYVKWANTSLPEKRLPGLDYSQNQMYWIAMANSWCAKYRPKILKTLVYEDVHSPNKYRVNGPLANIHEFSNDFGCSPDTRMNPTNKCQLW